MPRNIVEISLDYWHVYDRLIEDKENKTSMRDAFNIVWANNVGYKLDEKDPRKLIPTDKTLNG
jgi:hypothetical protein